MVRKFLVMCLLCLAVGNASVEAVRYQVVDLGMDYSRAEGINNTGQVVGSQRLTTEAGQGYHAYLWQNDTSIDLHASSEWQFGNAYDINDNGQITGDVSGNFYNPWFTAPFLYSNGSLVPLPTQSSTGTGYAINDAGQIVGDSGGGYLAFYRQNDAWIDLLGFRGLPNEPITGPSDINNSGVIVGRAATYGGNPAAYGSTHACKWTDGNISDLAPGLNFSQAFAINDIGAIVGDAEISTNHFHAVLWQGGVITDLEQNETTYHSSAYGINENGLVVGKIYTNGVATTKACLWKNGERLILPTLPGTTGSVANDINNNGWICGTYNDANGVEHAVLWQPVVPELASVVTLLCGLAGLSGALFRRGKA